jgi:hypothetical protein
MIVDSIKYSVTDEERQILLEHPNIGKFEIISAEI